MYKDLHEDQPQINHRSTFQNYNGYHEVRLPPKASKANAPSIENTHKKKLEGLKL